MNKIEDLMGDLVDRLAADPRGQVDRRAWRTLLTYAPLDLLKYPVAFRYKNGSDQWVYTENEAETQHALDTGHDSQALYVRDGTGHGH